MKRLTEAQKTTIAAGVMQGKRKRDIAAEAGCGESVVSHFDQYPGGRTMMAAMLKDHKRLVQKGMDTFLRGIIDDHENNPDNFKIRQACRAEFAQFVALGEGQVAAEKLSDGGEVTMRELLVHMREVVVTQTGSGE